MAKVLVIEDEKSLREEIIDNLRFENFEVIGAIDGVHGVEMAKHTAPDLIICDVMMPKLDGYGVLTQLRSDPANAAIPFIFLTAKVEKQDFRQGMELGADDYLTKPFTQSELLAAIQTRLEKDAAIRREAEQNVNTLRETLISTLPHELRTPLTSIIGYGELIKSDAVNLNLKGISDMAQWIVMSGLRLHRLVENYILYAQLEILKNDSYQVADLGHDFVIDSADIISSTAQQIATQYERESDLTLEVESIRVAISENYLKKVAYELIDNAFKFSTKGLPVKITARMDNQNFTMSIRDIGRGMSAEEIKKIGAYMQFHRAVYEQQGSGLGLAITKRLMELHHGRFSIESNIEQGTTVTIILPLIAP